MLIKRGILLLIVAVALTLGGCKSKEEKAEEAMRQGMHCIWSSHDIDKAFTYFEEYVKLMPDDARGYYYIGVCNMNKRNFDKSIELFNKAIELKSDYADAHYNKGLCYLLKENKDEACKAFYEALKYGKESIEDKIFDCERYYDYMQQHQQQ